MFTKISHPRCGEVGGVYPDPNAKLVENIFPSFRIIKCIMTCIEKKKGFKLSQTLKILYIVRVFFTQSIGQAYIFNQGPPVPHLMAKG